MFIDEVTIEVRSGSGGRGCESYHHRPDHKRIPCGGDGGDGGDIILKADPQTGSLFSLKSKRVFEAERGDAGGRNHAYGRRGKDFIVKVPCGTTVYNKRDNLLIRDLVTPGDEVIILKGGHGGYGNQVKKPATLGGEAKELELFLSYKMIADIFLVGFPNSGKTTLLKRLTGAGVVEADYPFATKTPQLGTYTNNYAAISMCEIPSIYGASEQGRGLGTHFLKHLERAKLVFWMLDAKTEFAENLKDGYQVIKHILKGVHEDFVKLPHFVVVNKSDLLKKMEQKKKLFPKERIYYISSKTGDGINVLMNDASEFLGLSHETAAR